MFRFARATEKKFNNLCEKVKSVIAKQDTNMREIISVKERVALTHTQMSEKKIPNMHASGAIAGVAAPYDYSKQASPCEQITCLLAKGKIITRLEEGLANERNEWEKNRQSGDECISVSP